MAASPIRPLIGQPISSDTTAVQFHTSHTVLPSSAATALTLPSSYQYGNDVERLKLITATNPSILQASPSTHHYNQQRTVVVTTAVGQQQHNMEPLRGIITNQQQHTGQSSQQTNAQSNQQMLPYTEQQTVSIVIETWKKKQKQNNFSLCISKNLMEIRVIFKKQF